METTVFKLGSVQGETITPFRYSNRFQIEKTTGADRIRIGAGEKQIALLSGMASVLAAPYFLLYVLHTSRCESQLGRYQSPPLNFQEINGFLAEFREYLTNDARHDLWIHSPDSGATLVWDRHDLIYAYGPLAQFRDRLKESLQESEVDGPPLPHVHMYHAEYDDAGAGS